MLVANDPRVSELGARESGFLRRLSGDFRIQTFTKTPTTLETLSLALDVLGGFRAAPPSPKLVDKAKKYLRGQFPLRVETPDAIAMRLAEIEFNGLPEDELATYRSRVEAVTPGMAGEAAQKHMPPPDDVAITVVGKASAIRAPLEAKFGHVRVVTPLECDSLRPETSSRPETASRVEGEREK